MGPVISITEMILVLVLACGLDLWVNMLKRQAFVSLNFVPYVWGIVIANLLMAGLWVYLAWVLLSRMQGGRWVSAVYLVVGLLLTILVATQLSIPESWRDWFFYEGTRMFRLMVMGEIGLTSRFTLSAALIGVLGGAGLIMSRKGR